MDRMNEFLVTGEHPAHRIPFLSFFAKSAAGGKSGDEDDDGGDDDEDDDEEDDEDDDDELSDLSDEELRTRLRESQDKLKRQSDRNARRRKREKKEREEAAKKPAPKPKAKDDDEDLETARENARREGESAGITRAKKAEAKSSLLAAGVNPARVARAVGLLDLDELDLDDDGLDGVDEAIEDLKKEWPELFAKQRIKRESVAGGGDRDGRGKDRRKTMTPSERQAAIATGRKV